MISSVNKLIQAVSEKIKTGSITNYRSNFESYSNLRPKTWSADKIAKLLGIKIQNEADIEGNVVFSMLGAKRVFAFGNDSFKAMPYSKLNILYSCLNKNSSISQ